MTKVLLSTTNTGKFKELHALLDHTGWNLVTPKDLAIDLVVEETGATYMENAILKAQSFFSASGLPTLADDTGLEVAALDGAPGLHSARFVQDANPTDASRRAKLLSLLSKFPRPWLAQYRCCVALALPDGSLVTAEGACYGEIIPDERGKNGFGYDPVFLFPRQRKTMAQLTMQEKNRISHRANAIKNLLEKLKLSPYKEMLWK